MQYPLAKTSMSFVLIMTHGPNEDITVGLTHWQVKIRDLATAS